ncbi:DMT family transporter, partial [Myxococcota bacterium]|nr:DMT family transporter [Myxococcota bacterium]
RGEGLTIEAQHLPGYLAAVGAAVIWAGYSVLNRRFGDVPSSMISIACLVVGVLGLAAHALLETWVRPTQVQALVIALMGLGPVGAAFRLWDRGTKKGDLALLGTLSYGAPLASTGLLLATGRAALHWTQAAACLCLVAGAWLGVRASRGR